MSGNVWEWCQDWYGSYSSDPQINPTGSASDYSRVYRGGGWSGGWDNNARSCRVSVRLSGDPTLTSGFEIGLRLAMNSQ